MYCTQILGIGVCNLGKAIIRGPCKCQGPSYFPCNFPISAVSPQSGDGRGSLVTGKRQVRLRKPPRPYDTVGSLEDIARPCQTRFVIVLLFVTSRIHQGKKSKTVFKNASKEDSTPQWPQPQSPGHTRATHLRRRNSRGRRVLLCRLCLHARRITCILPNKPRRQNAGSHPRGALRRD